MPVVLSPSTISSTFVSLDEGADADVAVRRDRGEFLLRWGLTYAGIAVLVAILPMCVVIWRPEPAYFTNSIVLITLSLAVAILVLGLLGTFLWSISASGRRHFDQPFMHLNAAGLALRVDDTEHMLPWDRIAAVRLVGPADRALAIATTPASDAELAVPEVQAASGNEAGEPLPDGDSDYTPPQTDWQPSRADFDAIAAASDDLGQEADISGTADPEPSSARHEEHWRQTLYGTPYVAQLRGCRPPLREIAPVVHSLSRGRITIPALPEDRLARLWRLIVRRRPAGDSSAAKTRVHPHAD